MKRLLIVNRGVLEVNALSLLGASTKRGDATKIGMFGSGNKYALAYLMRNNYKVRIVSGGTPIRISLKPVMMRDQMFDVLCINCRQTSITTEFGLQWKLWYAIRELYTNAVDEGLVYFGVIERHKLPECKPDETQIMIDMTSELEDFIFNQRDYLAAGKDVIFENEYGQILRKHGAAGRLYYRGILVYQHDDGSVFDYNVRDISLNEDRQAAYSWQIPQTIWKLLYSCTEPTVCRQVLTGIQGKPFIEQKIDERFADRQDSYICAEAWTEAVGENIIAPALMIDHVEPDEKPVTLSLPTNLFYGLVDMCKGVRKARAFAKTSQDGLFAFTKPNDVQQATLDAATNFLNTCQMMPTQPIKVVSFTNVDQLGQAKDGEILVSFKCLDRGIHETCVCILEEALHLTSGKSDFTRGFQNAIFEAWLNYAKKINNYTV
jgi:hypothetical protein